MKTKKKKKNFELPKKKLLGAASTRCNLLLRSVALVVVVVVVRAWGVEAAAIAQAGKKLLDQTHCQNGNVLEWGIIYAFK